MDRFAHSCLGSSSILLRRVARLIPVVLGAAVGVSVIGCASLDPVENIEQAAGTVEHRTGLEAAWDAPWNQVSDAWNGTDPISSDVAVLVALQNNRAIRRQVEAIIARRADYVQAHLLPNPVINFAIGFPTDGLGGDPLVVSLVQQLAWLWLRPMRIDEADAELQREVLTVSDAALRLVAEVRSGHADVVHAGEAVALQARNCALIERSLELVHRRFDVGESTRLDVNRLDLEHLQARAELVGREASLDLAKRRLLELLGRADHHVDWTASDADSDRLFIATALDESELVAMAGVQRLDIAAMDATVMAAASRLELAEHGRLPDVSVGVGYQQNFSNREGVFPSVGVTPKILDDNSARIAKATSELRQAEIEADRVRQQALREVRTAWVDLQAALELAGDFQKRIVELADENASLAERAFAAGTTDLTVLLEAQRRQTSARSRQSDLDAAAARMFFELERAAGGNLNPDSIVSSAAEDREPRSAAHEEASS